jgi:hypothetical protein
MTEPPLAPSVAGAGACAAKKQCFSFSAGRLSPNSGVPCCSIACRSSRPAVLTSTRLGPKLATTPPQQCLPRHATAHIAGSMERFRKALCADRFHQWLTTLALSIEKARACNLRRRLSHQSGADARTAENQSPVRSAVRREAESHDAQDWVLRQWRKSTGRPGTSTRSDSAHSTSGSANSSAGGR